MAYFLMDPHRRSSLSHKGWLQLLVVPERILER